MFHAGCTVVYGAHLAGPGNLAFNRLCDVHPRGNLFSKGEAAGATAKVFHAYQHETVY